VLENARAKRLAKGADVILANDVKQPVFDQDDNALVAIAAHGEQRFARQPKTRLAAAVVDWLAQTIANNRETP
jgi:phosphopantothenoylcysteine synthetase/decarboxylase